MVKDDPKIIESGWIFMHARHLRIFRQQEWCWEL